MVSKLEYNYYTDLCKNKNDILEKNVGWNSKISQELRFSVLKKCNIQFNDTILDVGCGYGDLYRWLLNNNYNVNYTGIDIIPKFIQYCKKTYNPSLFFTDNFFSYKKTHDWIFGSGLFCLKRNNWKQYVKTSIDHFYNFSNKGVIINFLRNPKQINTKMYYTSIEEVKKIIDLPKNQIKIESNYKDNDLSVIIIKQNEFINT